MSPSDNVAPGRLITLEGVDGAGKSTHLPAIEHWLRERGHVVRLTREPGGTPLAELLREAVLTRPMDALTEALVVFAARRDHLRNVIEPALRRGDVVLCDRFTDASFAYQGAGRGLSIEVLTTLEQWVQEQRQPDLTLWFDLDPQEAARRRAAVRDPDRFEQQDAEFYSRVRNGYRQRAEAWPARIARIDAGPAPQAVWQQIEATLKHQRWR